VIITVERHSFFSKLNFAAVFFADNLYIFVAGDSCPAVIINLTFSLICSPVAILPQFYFKNREKFCLS